MKKLTCFLIIFVLLVAALLIVPAADAYQHVKLIGRQLVADFDEDTIYEPYFVKGVGYHPVPIGHFIAHGPPEEGSWTADCWYQGPDPLDPQTDPNIYSNRFEHGWPSSYFDCGANIASYYHDLATLDRDMVQLQEMNANTIRTWGKVTPELLSKANEYGLKVMAGIWVEFGLDYTFPLPDGPAVRQAIIDDFVAYVNQFKSDPSILMWGLSNENNLALCNECVHGPVCDRAAQATGYFQLMNDMAQEAHLAEGTDAHPVMVVYAASNDLFVDFSVYGSLIPDVDIIGLNAYRGPDFDGWPNPVPDIFDEFDQHFPNKSMIIPEFGADAWFSGYDPVYPENGYEDEIGQSRYIVSAWKLIADHAVSKGGPMNGGVMFHYTDSFNDYAQRSVNDDPDDQCVWISSEWTPSVATQDYNYYNQDYFGWGVAPDDKVNPEWWGLMSVQKDSVAGQPDIMTKRLVYHGLKDRFGPGNTPPTVSISADVTEVEAGVPFTLMVSGTSPYGLASVWWGIKDLNDPSWHPIPGTVDGVSKNLMAAQNWGACVGELSCTYPQTVIIDEPGNYEIWANSRDILYGTILYEPHQASEGLGIPVVYVNVAPQFVPMSAQTAIAGEEMVLDVNATDGNGDTLSLEMVEPLSSSQFVVGETLLEGDGTSNIQGKLKWKPLKKEAGTYSVQFKAQDDNGEVTISEPVTIEVLKKGLKVKKPHPRI